MLIVKSDVSKAALKFVEALNSHDVTLITSLITPRFKFEDISESVKGKQDAAVFFDELFKRQPDYFIQINEMYEDKNIVIFIGSLTFSLGENSRKPLINSVWRAGIKEDLIDSWYAYSGAWH